MDTDRGSKSDQHVKQRDTVHRHHHHHHDNNNNDVTKARLGGVWTPSHPGTNPFQDSQADFFPNLGWTVPARKQECAQCYLNLLKKQNEVKLGWGNNSVHVKRKVWPLWGQPALVPRLMWWTRALIIARLRALISLKVLSLLFPLHLTWLQCIFADKENLEKKKTN